MGRYNLYYITSGVLLFIGLVGFAKWISHGYEEGALIVGLALLGVGKFQFFTAAYFILSKHKYPTWVEFTFRDYWIVVAAYFILLFAITRHFTLDNNLLRFWLFGLPWIIAIGQFRVVSRLGEEKSNSSITNENIHSHKN